VSAFGLRAVAERRVRSPSRLELGKGASRKTSAIAVRCFVRHRVRRSFSLPAHAADCHLEDYLRSLLDWHSSGRKLPALIGSPPLRDPLLDGHGPFSWSPLLLFAALGLAGFARRRPPVALPLIAMLLLLTYINGTVADRWAGDSFGAGSFDFLLPVLALGLATLIGWTNELVQRRPGWVVALFLDCFVLGNVLLMELVSEGKALPTDSRLERSSELAGVSGGGRGGAHSESVLS